jgi:hypothetical protein
LNAAAEAALVAILAPALSSLVADRITWDDEEIDLVYPAVTLRTLSSVEGSRDLKSRGGTRRSLVEISGHGRTSGDASRVVDAVCAALDFAEAGPFDQTVDGNTVHFGAIHLESIQQAPANRERSYRKSALFNVWLYE